MVFDAPAQHYKLRLTDEAEDEVSVDIPLSYIHEEMKDMKTIPQDGPVPLAVPKK